MSKFLYQIFLRLNRQIILLNMQNLAEKIEKFNERIGKGVSWLTFTLVIIVCFDVISRYLFNVSFTAVQELEWHIFAIIFLIAAPYTFKLDEHVRVDVIYSKLSDRKKAIINLVASIIFLIPFCLLVIYASKDFVINSFNINETSPDSGGLPARYILKAVIPLSFFLLLLQTIAYVIRMAINLKQIDKGEN